MAYYSFHLDSITCHHPRSKVMDADIVTFMVSVGNQPHGALVGHPIGIAAGYTVPSSAIPIDKGGRFEPDVEGSVWLLGPIYVEDEDIVTVTCSGMNVSDVSDNDVAVDKMELKILDAYYTALAGAWVGGVASTVEAVQAFLQNWGDFLEGVASAGGFFSGLTEWALGYEPPTPCNGLVFQGSPFWTGHDLKKLPFASDPNSEFLKASYTFSSDDSATHDKACGDIAHTDVTFSVWSWPYLSFYYFQRVFWPYLDFGLGPDPKGGIRQLVPPGQQSSLRELICEPVSAPA
jgi:hypothetical protein